MAAWQHIMIDGAPSREAVEAVVGGLVDAKPHPADGGVRFVAIDAEVGVFAADYADEPHLRMSHYPWVIDIDGVAQVDWTRRIFDALAEQTPWSLLWQSNSILVDARSGSAA